MVYRVLQKYVICVNNLTLDDILVKGDTDAIVKNSKGEEITRKKHEHMSCKCEHC